MIEGDRGEKTLSLSLPLLDDEKKEPL